MWAFYVATVFCNPRFKFKITKKLPPEGSRMKNRNVFNTSDQMK